MSKKIYRICLCIIFVMLFTAGCTHPAGQLPKETEPPVIATDPIETAPPTEAPTEAPTEPEPTVNPEDLIYTEVDETVYATTNVNIRRGPGADYERVGELAKNQAIRRVASGTNGWSKVILDDEVVFINSDYLTTVYPGPVSEPLPTARETVYALQDVNVRTGPGTNYDIAGWLREGTAIKRVSIGTDGWSKVIYKDKVCYVSTKYLVKEMPVETEPPTEAPTVAPTEPPKETEPSTNTPPSGGETHTHNYQAGQPVAPTCTAAGFTTYSCSCGQSYQGDEVPAPGHAWGEWSVTREATTTAEGEKTRTCGTCGATDTASIAKKAETIDTSALASYGNSYAASKGFTLDSGVRDGYFPSDTVPFTSMAAAKSTVAGNVDVVYNNIISRDGSVDGYRICVVVSDNGNGTFTVSVYYG